MRDPSVLTVGGIAVLKDQNPNRGTGVQEMTFLPGSLSPPSLLVLSREDRVQDLGAYSIVLWGMIGQLCTQPWEKTKMDADGNPPSDDRRDHRSGDRLCSISRPHLGQPA